MRIRSGGRFGLFALASLVAVSAAAPASPVLRARSGPPLRSAANAATSARPWRARVAISYCSTNGANAFVGGGTNDFAGGADAGIVAGTGNQACPASSLVAGGDQNVIGDKNEVALDSAIVGGFGNFISSTADGFVGGGASNSIVGGSDSFVGGGNNNAIGFVGTASPGSASSYGTIGGGYANAISPTATNGATYAFVGGGFQNVVNATNSGGGAYAAIAGGQNNVTNGRAAAIGGGENNVVGAADAVVPGGSQNAAKGAGSFAAGTDSLAGNTGAFVWSDRATGAKRLVSSASNQFLVRASGGVTFYSDATLTSGVKLAAGGNAWASSADRNALASVTSIDPAAILAKVEALPLGEWSYRTEPASVRHLGPTAQDFHAAFGLGDDAARIGTLDEGGVALAAIAALSRAQKHELAARDARIADLQRQVKMLAAAVATLQHGH